MSLDLEAMRALVGEAQVSADAARQALEDTHASAEDVSDPGLRPVWAVLEARVRNRQPIDPVGVREALRGQPVEVREAAMGVVLEPELGVARERLALLRDRGVRQRLLASLREVAAASRAGRPVAELEQMMRAAPAILAGAGSRVRNARGDAVAMLDHLEAQWAGRGVPQLRMGLGALDDSIGGLINNLTVIGARTGVGKSALVAGLVRNWLAAGHKVGVLAYEDDARDMAARIAACEAGVELKEMRGDKIPGGDSQWRRSRLSQISSGLNWYSEREHLLEVDDARPTGGAADVVASIRTMASRGCRVALLDNMTCVRLDGPDDRRHDLVVERALADIRSEAQSLRIPIIVVGHLKRGQTGADESRTPPKLSDFSNATAWENYSRVALGMWRGEGDQVCLRVLKQTNGPAGDDFDVEFRREAAVVTGTKWRAVETRAAEAPAEPRRTYSRSGRRQGNANNT